MAEENCNTRKSRKEKLLKIKEQLAAIDDCEAIGDCTEESNFLADELDKIKDTIRKRNNEPVVQAYTK